MSDMDAKVALAMMAYGQMDVSALLDSIAAQQRQMDDPRSSDEVRAIAARCQQGCRALLHANDAA